MSIKNVMQLFLLISVIATSSCSSRKQQLEKEIKTVEERLYQIQSKENDALSIIHDTYMPMMEKANSPEEKNILMASMLRSRDSVFRLGKQFLYEKDSLEFVLSGLKKQYDDK
jgi:hypothetical protein